MKAILVDKVFLVYINDHMLMFFYALVNSSLFLLFAE